MIEADIGHCGVPDQLRQFMIPRYLLMRLTTRNTVGRRSIFKTSIQFPLVRTDPGPGFHIYDNNLNSLEWFHNKQRG